MRNRTEQGALGAETQVDFTLHGLITIRIINAPASELRELESILGPSEGEPADQPDIRITYVDQLGPRDGLRYLGLNDAAYDERRFYVLNRRSQRASFDFTQLGERCEFICERGASMFPYLLPVIGLRLLRKGYIMLHAASMVYQDKGILVTGWQKGGKTEMLLAFMAAGAQYMADEWTIVSPSEGLMWGISGTLKIWGWHLRYLPEYWKIIPAKDRYRLRLHRLYQRAYRTLPTPWKGRGLAGQWMERFSIDGDLALPGLFCCPPARLFGDRVWNGHAPIDLVLLPGVGSKVSLSRVEPSAIARRMVASLSYERRALIAGYDQFRFAFPERRNEFLESAREREQQYLGEAIQSRPAYELLHPYPVPLNALYDECSPIVHELDTTLSGSRMGAADR